MKAGLDKVVTITYELRTEAGGDLFDSADSDNPLAFLFGHKMLLDRFEKNIEGLGEGSRFDFQLTPSEGYGEYDLNALVNLEKEMFNTPGVPQSDFLFVGNVLPLQDQNDNHFEGKITGITETHVVVDMNHPLAGKTLFFSGEVIGVREAHPQELAHGHVHHDGMHHH